MKVRAVDDHGKVRWATVPDDAVGELSRPLPLWSVVQSRARVVATVYAAVEGTSAFAALRKTYGLTRADMRELLQHGWGTARQLKALELAFQNAVHRVKIAR